MYPNETAEHHRDHRCWNKEVNQFWYDSISKYRGNFCGCIIRHHPVWAGSRSRVSRHLSVNLNIRGDEVRVRSCLIFRYRIWPKKQCILEKHSNLLQKYNSCRLLLPITHKYLSSHETRKHRHIFARVAPFWQRVFQTLPNLGVNPGVAVYHTLKIFFIVNAKDLLMPHTKFRVCTLKINAIFCNRKKKSHYFWTGVYTGFRRIWKKTTTTAEKNIFTYFLTSVDLTISFVWLWSAPYTSITLNKNNELLYSTDICLGIMTENKRLLGKRAFNTQVLPFIDACYKTKLTHLRDSVICQCYSVCTATSAKFIFCYIKGS